MPSSLVAAGASCGHGLPLPHCWRVLQAHSTAVLPICPRAALPIRPRAALPIRPRAVLPICPRAVLPICPRAVLSIRPRAVLPICPRALRMPPPCRCGKPTPSPQKGRPGPTKWRPVASMLCPLLWHGWICLVRSGSSRFSPTTLT